MPTQHSSFGFNWTYLSEGKPGERFIYEFYNGFYTTGQYFIGRGVGDYSMRNLNGSTTNTDEAVWGLVGAISSLSSIGEAKVALSELKATKGGADGIRRIYSARELLRRVEEPGPFHNFPEVFNNVIFENGTKTVTPNYFTVSKGGLSNTNILYQYPGIINGNKGFFEIGIRPSVSGKTEVIWHRFFNPVKRR
ncbi:hypothetical protein [Flavobacterium limi]|uniref:Uncharacterized protein n=1 Tax=Flavobacterium limi TaxID=2045105 RepID=A0ABQ1URS7_9FLAO|nr:hypothetical protein [Flavobacterium limi]GGF23839.1 hypothetical protein GCM10011518_36390 [Flavobacterium limi]